MSFEFNTAWISLLILALALGTASLVWVQIRDRKYLNRKTRDVLGEELKKEIEKEKAAFEDHQKKFNAALEKAKKKSP